MFAIVNVNENWAIGKRGKLINRFKEDMDCFKETTYGNTIIIGRSTLESFPGGLPLKGRKNIVLTREPSRISKEAIEAADEFCIVKKNREHIKESYFTISDNLDNNRERTSLIIVSNVSDAIAIANLVTSCTDKIFVCGGESIYNQFLPYCHRVGITMCYNNDPEADAFFPNLDKDENWKIVDRKGDTFSESGIKYEFRTYDKINKD